MDPDNTKNMARARLRKHRAVMKSLRELEAVKRKRRSSSSENDDSVDIPTSSENNTLQIHPVELKSSSDCACSDYSSEVFDSDSSESEDRDADVNFDTVGESSGEEVVEEEQDVNIAILEEEVPEIKQLKNWAVESRICQTYLDKLLGILRTRLLPTLPQSSKTFLGTSAASYTIHKMDDASDDATGEFVYFGIEQGLLASINVNLHPNNLIELLINVDGLPLFKSSNKQFWPILCQIFCNPMVYKPFTVAMFCGNSKPKSVSAYLRNFIEEMSKLQSEGIFVSGKHLTVKLKCFICDTPARAFLKSIKGHTGFHSCERCEVHGERIDKTIVFLSTDCQERTDEAFRTFQDPDHHVGVSPLLLIEPPIDNIRLWILDFLHLGCIGVMKRLLECLVSTDSNVKLSQQCKMELSRRMEHLRTQVPAEFQRKPRSLNLLAKWKATEYRFFLLYCGPIVLKGILEPVLYDHFLLLHTAFRILSSKDALKYTNYAKNYLKSFFEALSKLYGPNASVMNMHNLIHVADDVVNMGCNLSFITSFPFESHLGKIKRLLRSPHRPLAQFCRRLHEHNEANRRRVTIPNYLEIWRDNEESITKAKFKQAVLATCAPNDMIILNDNRILKIIRLFSVNQSLHVEGRLWKIKKSTYSYPTDSKILRSWEMEEAPSIRTLTISGDDMSSKLVMLSLQLTPATEERVFVMPLLHM